jgi:hypothetical protein
MDLNAFFVYLLAFSPFVITGSLLFGVLAMTLVVAPIEVWHGWGWRKDE